MARKNGSVIGGVVCFTAAYFLFKMGTAVQPPVPRVVPAIVPASNQTSNEIQTPTPSNPPQAAEPDTIQTKATQTGKPWTGPKWPKRRLKTDLDRTFQPTDEDSEKLTIILANLDVTGIVATWCQLRPTPWVTSLTHHITEVLEDPGTALGDPRGTQEAAKDRRRWINIYVERQVPSSALKTVMQDLCEEAHEDRNYFRDADEIVRRPLLRKHDEWEGFGSDH